ncbi:MAG TPA: hypothetical protein VFV36_10300 [Candidatus Methylomirabilis sp.]|nr:hypothetical protein [Candidatus Methylomirabilis sp.]
MKSRAEQRRETREVLRDVDRALREVSLAAAERTLQTATPGYGSGLWAQYGHLQAQFGVRVEWPTGMEHFALQVIAGCDNPACGCLELPEQVAGDRLRYRRRGRECELCADQGAWEEDDPRWNEFVSPQKRAAWSYWAVEDARARRENLLGVGLLDPGEPAE